MLWGCFSWNSGGPLVRIVGNMDAYAFKIIKEKIIQSCFKTFIGRIEFKFVLFLF